MRARPRPRRRECGEDVTFDFGGAQVEALDIYSFVRDGNPSKKLFRYLFALRYIHI